MQMGADRPHTPAREGSLPPLKGRPRFESDDTTLLLGKNDALRAKRLVGFCATHLPGSRIAVKVLAQRGPDEAPERLRAEARRGWNRIPIDMKI
jgi:hypothetical protein